MKKCEFCGRSLEEKDFFTKKGPDTSSLPLCKQCLCKDVDVYNPLTFLKILQWIDVPYFKDVWDSTVCAKEKTFGKRKVSERPQIVVGTYLAKMKLKGYKEYHWKDSDHL